MKYRFGVRAAFAVAVAVTLLAGCQKGDTKDAGPVGATGNTASPGPVGPTDNGVSALGANEILARAKAALKQAGSYRVKGNGTSDGQKMSLDFRISGNDLGGRLTMAGANIEVLSVASHQYIRPDEKFWANIAGADKAQALTKLMAGRWVVVPKDDKDFAELFGVASVDKLLKPDGKLTKGGTKNIGGANAIGLVDSGSEGGTLYVATTGEPYPLQMVSTNPGDGQINFTDFGTTFADLKIPAESQVIDLAQLSGN